MSIVMNILWSFICTLLFPIFISDNTLEFSNSFFSMLFWGALYLVLERAGKNSQDRRMKLYTHILGGVFACMISTGRALDIYGSIPIKRLLISIFFFSHAIAEMLSLIWNFLIVSEDKIKRYKPHNKFMLLTEKGMTWFIEHPYIITLFLLLCWLPCYIADFPGGFRYDATGELYQVENGYNGNYPLLHSVIITSLLPALYNLTGSYNTGVAVYVIVQMIMISCMYTHILYTFGKRNINRVVLLVVLLYCGCFPVIQILVVQEVRDVLFSALLVYAVFLFYLMVSDKDRFFASIWKPILSGITFVLALLARNNNAGAVMLVVVVIMSIIIWLVNCRNYLRGATVFALSSVISYLLLGTVLTTLCQPLAPAKTGESLSIMSQPIVRAYLYERERWTEDEVDELSTYIDLDGIWYCPENADETKHRLNIQGNFGDFFLFWCKIGMKHPGCYLDAILANTQNMWYPDSVIDGYNQVSKGTYEDVDKCYYAIRANLGEPVVHMNLWPEVLNYYTRIGMFISFEKIPVVSMFFSIGFQFWVVLNCFFYVVYRKLNKLILPLAIILGYMLISACVPLVLMRYFAAVFFAVPMLVIFTLQPEH